MGVVDKEQIPYCSDKHEVIAMEKIGEYMRGIEKVWIKYKKYPCEVYVTEFKCSLCQKMAKYCKAVLVGRPTFTKTWTESVL